MGLRHCKRSEAIQNVWLCSLDRHGAAAPRDDGIAAVGLGLRHCECIPQGTCAAIHSDMLLLLQVPIVSVSPQLPALDRHGVSLLAMTV